VHLVPTAQLAGFVAHANDEIVVKSLSVSKSLTEKDIVAYQFCLSSARRIVYTVAAYRRKFGEWPSRISIDQDTAEAIKAEILTPLGWKMLLDRVEVDTEVDGSLISEGPAGRFDYADFTESSADECRAVSLWIWGIDLGG
jgi:hypothetical protein